MPDDIGNRDRIGSGRRPSGDEPPDLTALYEDDEIPASRRNERVRPDEWRVAPSRPPEPREQPEGKPPEEADKKPAETPEQAARRRRKRWLIAGIVAALLLAAGIGFGWYWYTTLRWLESTDDAYTQADNTIIAPKVAGYVKELLVTDNQAVNAGEVLLRIDPRDYQAALDQAQADVLSAEANIRNIDAQIAAQQSVIDQARADVASAEAALTFSQQEYARYQALVQTGAGTVQRAQQAAADLRDKTAALQHQRATLDAAIKQIGVLKTQRGVAEATLLHNRAVLEQAKLNLGYTAIAAPIAGAVGDRTVRIGQYVQPGAQLMTIVPMGSSIYVVANFKETQIRRMFRGEHVDLTIDSFPGLQLSGSVDSLAPGSGAQFALLPPENATGNFTKIVQRVPVKILIDPAHNPMLDRLRPGLSVVATVDLRTAPPEGTPTLVPPRRGAR